MLIAMELRHLKYFVTVAEERNITRAAGRLRVAQPALSRQLSDLENEYAKAKDARDQVHAAEAVLRARRHALKQTDRQLATLLKRFASGVRGHGAFGTNCPFYRALGFVTDDRNRGGRPRGAGKKQ